MRVVIQRVKNASVRINDIVTSNIRQGLVVLVGIEAVDSMEDVEWLVAKIINQRVFSDIEGKMNISLKSIKGEILVVSQFTLHAKTMKGDRPSFIRAARPEYEVPLYDYFVKCCEDNLGDEKVKTGDFGADMLIELINDGPVTITIDSKNRE